MAWNWGFLLLKELWGQKSGGQKDVQKTPNLVEIELQKLTNLQNLILGWLDCLNGSPKLFYEELSSVHYWHSRVVYHIGLSPGTKGKKFVTNEIAQMRDF